MKNKKHVMHPAVKFLFDEIERQDTNIFSISAGCKTTSQALYSWRNGHRTPRVDYLDSALKTLGYQLTVAKRG
ncbi:MAG TPA: hypothetical protein VMV86_02905 [Methanosarcinales archaeon]|nr:hypothetical protein [Methanosarcinales archaeon]